MRSLTRILLTAATLMTLTACDSATDTDATRDTTNATDATADTATADAATAADAAADTAPDAAVASPFPLDWAALRNPILARDDRMLKDQSVVYHDGWFYVYASTRFEPNDPPPPDSVFYAYRTRDFAEYEELRDIDAGHGSPDISWDGERWVVVYQVDVSGNDDALRRLFAATSDDLLRWSDPTALLANVQPGTRHIDGGLAHNGERYYMLFKSLQIPMVTGADELVGPWDEPQFLWIDGVMDWAENYQLLRIDGARRMVATARDPDSDTGGNEYTGNHEPFLYTMAGDGDRLEDWTQWVDKTHLEVPMEDWNTVMHANSAFLCDWREHDGYFYLFYAGSNDDERFDGRGHGKIGVARSRDLVTWRVAGDTRE